MPSRSCRIVLAAALPALVAGCRGADSNPGRGPGAPPAGALPDGNEAAAAPDASGAASNELAALAIGRVEAGQYEAARLVLDDLLFDDALLRARNALAAGVPEDALTAVDEALALVPEDEEARLLKADASLGLAETRMRDGGAPAGLIEGTLSDALEFYESLGENVHALIGASRAAGWLGRPEEALALARRARDARGAGAGGTERAQPGARAERLLAEQFLAAYERVRAAGSDEAAELFTECEDALSSLLGRESTDPWTWSRLADLYESVGRWGDARRIVDDGLLRAPEDAQLVERLARATRGVEGGAAVVGVLERYVAEHPRVVAGRWQLALAHFELALERFQATPRVLDTAAFRRAETEFAGARELAPDLAQGALGYEVICRLARGWCAFHAGELATAEREFLSMNELMERGIEWALPEKLESGIQGLFRVADAYDAREDGLAAAETFETLRSLQPDVLVWANNAALFLREAASDLESEGARLCRASRGLTVDAAALEKLRGLPNVERAAPGSAEERAAFERAAEQRFARARLLMERCFRAYEGAAALAADDVRVINDAALILVHYLHRDLERAEAWLQHAIALGAEQVRAKEAALEAATPESASTLESELFNLQSAWGDAHENLGVLYWIHRDDAARALPLLERAVEIGPDRPSVVNELLPQVRGTRALDEDDRWNLLNWARPCARH